MYQPTQCSVCHGEAEFLGKVPLRKGGTSGAALLFFGQLAELEENVVELEVFRCGNCTHIELYDVDKSLPKLTNK